MKITKPQQSACAETYLPTGKFAREIVRKGARDGVRGIDKLASPTTTEQELAAQYAAIATVEASSAQGVVSRGLDTARRREPVPGKGEVRSVTAGCTARLKALSTEIRAEMGELWNGVVAARAQLERFKVNAGIDGDARYPESRVSHFGSLYLIGLGEAMANAWFYGSASPHGLGAGLLQAAIISTILIGAGAMAGCFALRSCFSPNRVRRGFGFAGMGAYVAFGVFISLAAASFRDALAKDNELNGMMLPIGDILRSPPQLSFEAITLLAFAVMASALALYKGFTSDSAVPGHGLLDRNYRRAVEAYKATWLAATAKVTEGRQQAEQALEEMVSKSRRDLEQRERLLANARAAIATCDTTQALLASGYDYAVKLYRDAADVVAPNSPWPAPQSLAVCKVNAAGIDAVEAAVAGEREQLEHIQALVACAGNELNEVAAKVQSELEGYRAGLEAAHAPGVPSDSPKLKLVAEAAIRAPV